MKNVSSKLRILAVFTFVISPLLAWAGDEQTGDRRRCFHAHHAKSPI